MSNPEILHVLGQFGKKRDEMFKSWDAQYGEDNWKIGWQLANGTLLDFNHMFCLFIASYIQYFREHPEEARVITTNYAYAYDDDPITYEEAFDVTHLLDKPGIKNQFHHVAMNRALVNFLGLTFIGSEPLQVRMGKSGTLRATWPKGYRWSPGRIPAVVPQKLFPDEELTGWWDNSSIEDLYQKSKVLVIKRK